MLPDLGEGQRTLRQKYLGRGTLGWTWAPRVVWQKPELPFAAIKASETTPLKPYTPSGKFPAVQSGFDAGGPLVQPPSSLQMTPSVRGPLLPGPTAQRPPRPWRPDDLTYEVCRPHSPVWAMVKTLVAYRSGWSTWASEMLFNLYYLSRIPLDAKAYGGTRPLWQWRIYRAYAEGMINHFNHVARLHRTHGAPRLLSLMRWVPPLFVWSFQRAYNRLAAQVSFKS